MLITQYKAVLHHQYTLYIVQVKAELAIVKTCFNMLFNVIQHVKFLKVMSQYCSEFYINSIIYNHLLKNYFSSHRNAFPHYVQLKRTSNTNNFWSGPYLKSRLIFMLFFFIYLNFISQVMLTNVKIVLKITIVKMNWVCCP